MGGIIQALRRLNPRREAIYLLQALAEACLLAPWLKAVMFYVSTQHGRDMTMLNVASATFFIMVGIAYLMRGMGALGVSVPLRRLAALGLVVLMSAWGLRELRLDGQWPNLAWLASTVRSLATFTSLLPASLSIVMATVFLLWRGLNLAQKPLSVFDVVVGFQVGVVVFAIFVFASSQDTRTVEETNPFIIAFFFCQLLAIGLTRVETVGDLPGGKRAQFGLWWLTMLTGCTALVMVTAGLILGFVMGVGPEYILVVLQPILAIVLIPLSIVIIPLLALVGMVAQWIVGLIDFKFVTNLLEPVIDAGQAATTAAEAGPQSPLMVFAAQALGYGKGLLVLLILGLIVVGFVWATGRLQARRATGADEEYESVWSLSHWASGLRRRLGQRLKRLAGAVSQAARLGAGGFFTALTIRRIYAQLQHLAGRRGYPRNPASTPYEYLPTLHTCFPGCQADLARLTEAYVGIHYGELPERPEDLDEIRAAWERIRESSEAANGDRRSQQVSKVAS